MKGYMLFTDYLRELESEGIYLHRATAKKHAQRYIKKFFGKTLYIKESVVDDYIEFYLNHHKYDYKLLTRLTVSQATKILDEFININDAAERVSFHPATIRYHVLKRNNNNMPKVNGRLYPKKKEIEELYGVELR